MDTAEPGRAAPSPLQGIRVVEVAHNLAGPFGGQILADLGAEVVKVERPGSGDPARSWGPPFCNGDGAAFASANRNKKSVALDLKSPEDRDAFQALVDEADVLLESLRPGALERLGFSYGEVAGTNPGIIFCSVLAYGEEGPLREHPGFDLLMQAHAGLVSVTGPPGGPSVRVGTSVVDYGTGMWLALAVLASLRERDRTGEGARITVSLFDTALVWNSYHLLGYLSDGYVPGLLGTELPMIAPYGAFPTSDGELMVAAGNNELFRRACGVLGLDELVEDPRFQDNPDRVRNRVVLNRRFSQSSSRFSTEELLTRLRSAGVPGAPVHRIDEVVADAQTRASGMLVEAVDASGDSYPSVALPIRWSGERSPLRSSPPRMGQDTELVFRGIGKGSESRGKARS